MICDGCRCARSVALRWCCVHAPHCSPICVRVCEREEAIERARGGCRKRTRPRHQSEHPLDAAGVQRSDPAPKTVSLLTAFLQCYACAGLRDQFSRRRPNGNRLLLSYRAGTRRERGASRSAARSKRCRAGSSLIMHHAPLPLPHLSLPGAAAPLRPQRRCSRSEPRLGASERGEAGQQHKAGLHSSSSPCV